MSLVGKFTPEIIFCCQCMNKFAVGCLHYYVMWQHVDEMKAASIFLQFLRFWKHLFNCLCCLASCYHCIKDKLIFVMVFLGRQVAHNHKFMSMLSSRFGCVSTYPSFFLMCRWGYRCYCCFISRGRYGFWGGILCMLPFAKKHIIKLFTGLQHWKFQGAHREWPNRCIL